MKKFLTIAFTLAMAAFVLSGCVLTEGQTKIENDGSSSMTMTVGFEKEAYEKMVADLGGDSSESGDATSENTSEEFEYNGKTYIGSKTTRSFDNIAELNEMFTLEDSSGVADVDTGKMEFALGDDGSLTLTLTANGNTGSVDQSGLEGSDVDMSEIEAMLESVVATMSFDFPATVEQTKGDSKGISIDGSKLTIDFVALDASEDGESVYEFKTAAGAVDLDKVKASKLSVEVSGTPVEWTDAEPFIDENSRTMVPLRAVAEALEIEVEWDSAAREAVFTSKDEADGSSKTIAFPIDGTVARTVVVDPEGVSTESTVEMDTAAIIRDSRTYAPARYLAEFFGHEVSWSGATKTVRIN